MRKTLLILAYISVLCLGLVVALRGQTEPRAIVSWNPIPDPSTLGYKVHRGTIPTVLSEVATVALTAWQDDSIEPTIKYYYAVRGYNSQPGTLSAPVQFRFSDVQPASPAGLTAVKVGFSAGRVTVKADWQAVTKTRSLLVLPVGSTVTYNVFISNTGTIQKFTVLQGTSFTVSDLRKNKTVYFYVTSVLNGVESLGSPAVRVQT